MEINQNQEPNHRQTSRVGLEDNTSTKKKPNSFKSNIYTVLMFILAFIFAALMIVFVLRSYVVDGSSMEPILQNGDRVIIYKLPKTIAEIRGQEYLPGRGDIIVFKKPNGQGTELIKRVIGLPGERVVVKDNSVIVYNEQNPAGFNPDADKDYESFLPVIDTGNQITDLTVGENELFVLGDNRALGGSLDSHSGLGLVPLQNVVGKLWLRYYPLNQMKIFGDSTNYLRAIY